MPDITEKELLADAVRIKVQRIDHMILMYNRLMDLGYTDAARPYAHDNYPRYLAELYLCQQKAAKNGWTDPLFQPKEPRK